MFYAPGQDIQRPTHPRLHVRDTRDAQTVLEAVRRGLLKPVSRRLNEMERSMYIQSGSIFVWEESDDELGLKRWTDGKMWSQSRMREVKFQAQFPNVFYLTDSPFSSHISSMMKRLQTSLLTTLEIKVLGQYHP